MAIISRRDKLGAHLGEVPSRVLTPSKKAQHVLACEPSTCKTLLTMLLKGVAK